MIKFQKKKKTIKQISNKYTLIALDGKSQSQNKNEYEEKENLFENFERL